MNYLTLSLHKIEQHKNIHRNYYNSLQLKQTLSLQKKHTILKAYQFFHKNNTTK